MSGLAWTATVLVLLAAAPARAATKTGTILEGAENLKIYSFTTAAATGEIVMSQSITLSWDEPDSGMVGIVECREVGTTDARTVQDAVIGPGN